MRPAAWTKHVGDKINSPGRRFSKEAESKSARCEAPRDIDMMCTLGTRWPAAASKSTLMLAEHVHRFQKLRRCTSHCTAASAARAATRGGTRTTTSAPRPSNGHVSPRSSLGARPAPNMLQRPPTAQGDKTVFVRFPGGGRGGRENCWPSRLCHQRSVSANRLVGSPLSPLCRRRSNCSWTMALNATWPKASRKTSIRSVRFREDWRRRRSRVACTSCSAALRRTFRARSAEA
mmetsp:Transcript_56468/g.163737  ORF Transcript_56468/g.163737 Transcript_56468/m.163737 type:complete len:233 (+) Transcript_56468:1212-1910(+)